MGRYDLPDPRCRHVDRSVMVSSHADLAAASEAGGAMCSTRVCFREFCIEDAKEWVRAHGFPEPVVTTR